MYFLAHFTVFLPAYSFVLNLSFVCFTLKVYAFSPNAFSPIMHIKVNMKVLNIVTFEEIKCTFNNKKKKDIRCEN